MKYFSLPLYQLSIQFVNYIHILKFSFPLVSTSEHWLKLINSVVYSNRQQMHLQKNLANIKMLTSYTAFNQHSSWSVYEHVLLLWFIKWSSGLLYYYALYIYGTTVYTIVCNCNSLIARVAFCDTGTLQYDKPDEMMWAGGFDHQIKWQWESNGRVWG